MVVATEEHLDGARKEIDVLRNVKHPHVISLLESSIVQGFSIDEGMNTVYMLFPWYKVSIYCSQLLLQLNKCVENTG